MSRRRRIFKWVGISLAITAATLGIIAWVMIRRATPILEGRIKETLSTRFKARVELDRANAFVFRGLEVSGDGLSIYPPDAMVAAGATKPLIHVKHFAFHSGLLGLFLKPTHIGAVRVDGLEINIPPREIRQKVPDEPKKKRGKIKMVVDEIICDHSRLLIETLKPDKDPKDFELKHIEMHNVGPNAPWKYVATLTNAIPRGEIHSTGTFGPWQTDDPGQSSVTGRYTFEHADLNTIKGIGGILSSIGKFQGQLDRIEVEGTTETPDFMLDTGGRPMPLHTSFKAIVDGTSGDTYLQPVNAKLRDAVFSARGAVINIKGVGHRIDLDVDVPGAPIQDFLDLAVATNPPVLTGSVNTRTRLRIRPGKESVSRKLGLQGNFTLREMHFTNPKVQDKVDSLSLRARGKAKLAKPGAKDVNSQMTGAFQMSNGVLHFSRLTYVLPGGRVNLAGAYSLDGQQFDFRGKIYTSASLPHLVKSRWASLALRAISPFFFKGENGGAEIPITVTGTRSEPKFGLDVFNRKHD